MKKLLLIALTSFILSGCSEYKTITSWYTDRDNNKEVENSNVHYVDCCDPNNSLGTLILCIDLKNAPNHTLGSGDSIYVGTCFN